MSELHDRASMYCNHPTASQPAKAIIRELLTENERLKVQAEQLGKAWPNGCDRTAPEALRFLAQNDRPNGGQDRFNAEHLMQIADELERASAAPPSQAEQRGEPVAWVNSKALKAWTENGSRSALVVQLQEPKGQGFAALYTAPPAPAVPDDVAKDAARYRAILPWLQQRRLLQRVECSPDVGVVVGHYYMLYPPYIIDARNGPIGYGLSAEAAIDHALLGVAPELGIAGDSEPRVTPRPAAHKRPPRHAEPEVKP